MKFDISVEVMSNEEDIFEGIRKTVSGERNN